MKKRRITIFMIITIVVIIVIDIYYFISGPYNLQINNNLLKQKVEESLNVGVDYAYTYIIDEQVIVFKSEDTYYFYNDNQIFIEEPLSFFDKESFDNYVTSEYNLKDFKSGLSTYHKEAVKYAVTNKKLLVFDENDKLVLDFNFDND